ATLMNARWLTRQGSITPKSQTLVGCHAFAAIQDWQPFPGLQGPRKHATQRRALGSLCFYLVGLVLICCSACAPVDRSAGREEEKSPELAEVVPEKINLAPKPLPTGPRYRIESAVQNVRERDLLTTNGFWTVFHGILGLG